MMRPAIWYEFELGNDANGMVVILSNVDRTVWLMITGEAVYKSDSVDSLLPLSDAQIVHRGRWDVDSKLKNKKF